MLLLHLGLVVGVVATTWLGFWQLGAWQGHREDRVEALADLPPVPLDSVIGPDDPFPTDDAGRPVTITGEWLPDETVEVTGRLQHGDTGSWVVVPLAVCDAPPCDASASVVPVVVGWTQQPGAAPAPPSGPAEVVARLQPAEQDDSTDSDTDDDVLPSLRIPDFVTRIDADLYSGFVVLDEPASLRGDLEAVTAAALPSPPASTGLRNLLYAVQWWVFTAFTVLVWWRWSRDELVTARAARSAGPSPDGPDEPDEGPRLPSQL